ncbi:hypothetical protein KP509_36G055600 [Ceratopteris richardii]|uniref:Complex 1 LYR protein n=1 Tax=Ceratopteris richardii TaxID=49495 RepID=A0A8T2QDT3_CERRI|nr:hypothetical protein KP509_36G055600 [Ceratopteris richardii]KAH7281623.1 hypothetical protein KP509_36G055600 [Ceratopteris richardii]
METRAVYRNLLKTLRKHVAKEATKTSFRDYITKEFRKNAGLKDKIAINRGLQLAKDYALLVQSVHHHKELLFSYNIAIDRSAEQKERMKNTAERVGLHLPKLEYEESEDSLYTQN